ncbi:MAG: aldose 1-epimerase, partial [Candidatus Omnitrophica bacterium]|nr:aldose 1-epimerase [Candidatus Omnitrophota bacterium]
VAADQGRGRAIAQERAHPRNTILARGVKSEREPLAQATSQEQKVSIRDTTKEPALALASSAVSADANSIHSQLKPLDLHKKLAEALSGNVRFDRPIRINHIAPFSLKRYADNLQRGFEEIGELDVTMVTHTAVDNETAVSVAVRARPADADTVTLLQVHGAGNEIRLLEEVIQANYPGRLIVLIHRPEELYLRFALENKVDPAQAKSILKGYLGHADAVVVLGESAVADYQQLLPDKTIVAIPHGFFATENLLAPSQRFDPAQVAVIGSNTTWGEMRHIRDVIDLHKEIQSRGNVRTITYVAGKFDRNVNAAQLIDNNDIYFLSNEEIRKAQHEKKFIDFGTYKKWLYKKAAGRIIIRALNNDSMSPESFTESDADLFTWEDQLIDFNVQLYREFLDDLREKGRGTPKFETSGTLHRGNVNEIFITFDSPSMRDVVAREGYQMLFVTMNNGIADFKAAADEIEQLIFDNQHRIRMLENNRKAINAFGMKEIAYAYSLLAAYFGAENQGAVQTETSKKSFEPLRLLDTQNNIWELKDKKNSARIVIDANHGFNITGYYLRRGEKEYNFLAERGNPIMFPFANLVSLDDQGKLTWVDSQDKSWQQSLLTDELVSGKLVTKVSDTTVRHGFVRNHPFRIIDSGEVQGQSYVVAEWSASDYPAIPELWQGLKLYVLYVLNRYDNNSWVTMITWAQNVSDHAMPIGFGLHPWFNAKLSENSKRSDIVVSMPRANRRWETNDQLLPTGSLIPVEGAYDFRRAKKLGDNTFDSIFTHEPVATETSYMQDAHEPAFTVEYPEGFKITGHSDKNFKNLVLYVPKDNPDVFCVEPQTSSGDSFKMAAHTDAKVREAANLIILEPGETKSFASRYLITDTIATHKTSDNAGSHNASNVLEDLRTSFALPTSQVNAMVSSFISDMHKGLAGQPSASGKDGVGRQPS